MHQLMQLLKIALTAFAATVGIAVVAIIFVMFTTKDTGIRRTGLFDSVFFESIDNGDGSLHLRVGVNNPLPLAIIWTLLTVTIFTGYMSYQKQITNKKSLDSTPDNALPPC